MRKVLLILALAAAFAAGYLARRSGPDSAGSPEAAAAVETRWTCSMHPQIILPSNDQQCPICFMDLIPLEETGSEGLRPEELALSANAAALAEIRVTEVRRQAVSRDIRLVGKVTADETRISTITARFSGRLDRLFVDTTGQKVRPGMPLAEIYSPELYSAQAELQAAARAAADGAASAEATYRSAQRKMDLWGLTAEQIEQILAGELLSSHLTVTAPTGGVVVDRQATLGRYVKTGTELYAIADLSRVWVTLDAFETDVASLREGQTVSFTARALPGRTFTGEVLFVNPVMNERSRTVEVRVEVDNADGHLKPGMLVTGRVAVALDAAGQAVVTADPSDQPLVIPATAPLLTGDRSVVYVRRSVDGERAVFAGRQVVLGPRAGDIYVVLEGLTAGEDVVTHGVFKIDSALQILAKPSMMNPAGEGAHPATPEFKRSLGDLVAHYYVLQAALAGDDDIAAKRAVTGVASALDLVDQVSGTLDAAAADRWQSAAAVLTGAVRRMTDSPDLTQRRLPLEDLSDTLWETLLVFDYSADNPVRRFHCPMALDGKGANWIQADTTTTNPYYGSAMLRCGWEVEVIK